MRVTELKRAAITLAALCLCFAAYSQFIVPLIEPPARQRGRSAANDPPEPPRITDRYLADLRDLFGDGSWETRSPKVLRHGDTMLLFRHYESQDNGSLRLHPCTVVMWREDGTTQQRADSALVLQAPEGATLQLSQPIDLRSAELGEPISGQLTGSIRIHSRGQADGTGHLDLTTSNVFIDATRLYTSEEVEFVYERHRGRGRDLLIHLLPRQLRKRRRAPGWAGIRSIELVHLDHLRLELERTAGSDVVDGSVKDTSQPEKTATNGARTTPVDIACRGPLRIDFVKHTMTLDDQVELRRHHAQGVVDTLYCEHLQLSFEYSPTAPADSATGRPDQGHSAETPWAAAPKLSITRVLAEGNPVVLDAPSRHAQLRGRRLGYDLQGGRFWLTPDQDDAADRIWLRLQEHQLLARSLHCDLSVPASESFPEGKSGGEEPQGIDRVQRLRAIGPGVYQGQQSNDSGKTLTAEWHDRLVFQRDDPLKQLTLSQNALVRFGADDSIGADLLHLWLEPDPVLDQQARNFQQTTDEDSAIQLGSIRLRPKRLLAMQGDSQHARLVTINSAGVAGSTNRLQAYFVYPMNRPSTQTHPISQPIERVRVASTPPEQNRGGGSRSNQSAHSNPLPNRSAAGKKPDSLTRVAGDDLSVILRMQHREVVVQQLELDRNVVITQFPSHRAQRATFRLAADQVQMERADADVPIISASGAPVQIRSDEMLLQTTRLWLDQTRGRAWTQQPGQMVVLVDRDANGNPLTTPQEATVDWQRQMEFDGQLATFWGNVEVRGPNQRLRAAEVELMLNRRLGFGTTRSSSALSRSDIELARMRAAGNVQLDTRTVHAGELTGITYVQVPHMQLDRQSGDLLAGGPGRVVTVRKGYRNALTKPNRRAPNKQPSASEKMRLPRDESARVTRFDSTGNSLPSAVDEAERKTFLQIDFQKEVTGNIHRRIVTFHERIEVIYGPVTSWNETIRAEGPVQSEDVLLSCEQLTIAQGRPLGSTLHGHRGSAAPLELSAAGNAFVEGQTFTASGERISYDQAKGLLVLEGAGNTFAVLTHQARVGAQRNKTEARKILYWPEKERVEVDAARSFQFGF